MTKITMPKQLRAHPVLLPSTLILFCSLLCAGCSSSLLPIAKGRQESPWESFTQAKQTFDRITPYQTNVEELQGLAFSPFQNPNIEIVSYLDLINRFIPNSSFRKEDLAPGILDCIESHDGCYGYELKTSRTESRRFGNVFLDLFNFKRQTHKTGWQFTALIIIKENQVVYKLWSGKPQIDEYIYKKNPLGPIQESESLLQSIGIETTFD